MSSRGKRQDSTQTVPKTKTAGTPKKWSSRRQTIVEAKSKGGIDPSGRGPRQCFFRNKVQDKVQSAILGNKKPRKQRVCEVSYWCGKRDLNPYVKDTRPSNVPVCQFQHCRIFAVFSNSAYLLYHSCGSLSSVFSKKLSVFSFSSKSHTYRALPAFFTTGGGRLSALCPDQPSRCFSLPSLSGACRHQKTAAVPYFLISI